MIGLPHVPSGRAVAESRVLDRSGLAHRYRQSRARSAALFDLIDDEAYYARPIALRLPFVFYEGHLPFFSFSTLVRRALGRPSIDQRMEALFARGIDPHEAQASSAGATRAALSWPTRSEVGALAAEADRQVLDALENAELERPGDPLLQRAESALCISEHEAMHQETLLYMLHRLPPAMKRRPAAYLAKTEGAPPAQSFVDVPIGSVTIGVDPDRETFTWDNERLAHTVSVGAFHIERHNVTNSQFMEFIEAGGYRDERWWRAEDWRWVHSEKLTHPPFWIHEDGRWWWRGMFEIIALPPAWPVYVTQAEATAFARWRGARLPTEAEYHRAACGDPNGRERRHPWGDDGPEAHHGVFDFSSFDPEPAGSHPAGASAWGVEDLVGNGWEWTSSVFAPFPGFEPLPCYPEYSADFFDGEHFVMKGASPATARELLRPSFRNWFRARYPYVYATFRCVKGSPNEGRG